MEIEIDDSFNDISDGESAYSAQSSSRMTSMVKNGLIVSCYRWVQKTVGVEEDYFVCPMCRKSVKL
jgi:hypothetical protein